MKDIRVYRKKTGGWIVWFGDDIPEATTGHLRHYYHLDSYGLDYDADWDCERLMWMGEWKTVYTEWQCPSPRYMVDWRHNRELSRLVRILYADLTGGPRPEPLNQ